MPLPWPIPVIGLHWSTSVTDNIEHIGPNWPTHYPKLNGSLMVCDAAVSVPAANMGIIGRTVVVSRGVLVGHRF